MEKGMETTEREIPVEQFPELVRLFGKEGFNPEKSIRLKKDVDQDNNERELGNYDAVWTELRNPDTEEVVEAKIYIPKEGKIDKVLIICPGYRGDFVLQESNYADDFAKSGRVLVVLRHNSLKIDENSRNYVHCPEKLDFAKKNNQQYTGKGENFSFSRANREVLTALKSLSGKIDEINSIDVLAHSWGSKISSLSISELERQSKGKDERADTARKISQKVKNLVLIGPWLIAKEGQMEAYREAFTEEVREGFFKNMDLATAMTDLKISGQDLLKLEDENFPEQMRIVPIFSVGEEENYAPEVTGEDLQKAVRDFLTRLEKLKKGFVVLKDLSPGGAIKEVPEAIGGREVVAHDYALGKTGEASRVRQWVREIIK